MPAPHPRMHGLTHVPGGPDPIPGFAKIPSGDTIDALIEALDPAGWWKLNEDSGHVAADSSGNGLDMSTTSPEVDPLWGQPAGPPGEQTADFNNGTSGAGGTAARVSRSWAALTGDFTVGIFISRDGTAGTSVMGQGNPSRSGGAGFQLGVFSAGSGTGFANRPFFDAKAAGTVIADNGLAASTWAMLAGVHSGTSWRLNVNGIDQSTPVTGTYTSSSGPLWIGHDGGLGGGAIQGATFTGSYAFLIPTAVTEAELLDIYNSTVLPGGANAGKALLTTGLGGTYWDFPLEVTY